MTEYIEREKVLNEFDDWIDSTGALTKHTSYYYEYKSCIEDVPAADVAVVRHGKWLDNIEKATTPAGITRDFAIGYKCSLCGRKEISKEPYCNCGAKMGDDEE